MSMRLYKKIMLALLILLIVIQFIQPARNSSGQVLRADITKAVGVPDSALHILKIACYDCHSNNTRYPLYAYLQPMGWMMASHISNGKANVNFSEFGTYSKRKQANKLRSITTSIQEGSMPISSYIIMHKDARLSAEDKNIIIGWASAAKDSLEKN